MGYLPRTLRFAIGAAVTAGLTAGLSGIPLGADDTRVLDAADQAAQQPAPAAGQDPGRGGRRGGGGGGGRGGAPIPFTDATGFKPIFDGKTLSGWDGDPQFWRVENGAITGESTPEKVVKPNTFIVWRGGEPADFELKVEFRIGGGNTGVQYRSVEMPEVAKWVLKGYQADIDFNNQYTGMLYEERGRAFLAPRGTLGYVGPNQPPAGARGTPTTVVVDGKPTTVFVQEKPATPPGPRGQLAALEDGAALQAHIKQNDWNQFHVIARGTVLIHILNGRVMAAFVDDDATNRSMKGLIGLQLHSGPPMKVEFRNIWLKTL